MQYSRVLTTSQAKEQCQEKDHKVRQGGRTFTSFGRNSLETVLRRQQALEKEGETKIWTVHKGDIPFETAAKNIVGFVAWDSVPTAMYDDSMFAEDCKALLKKVNTMTASASVKLQSLEEIDWVYRGDDFSEYPTS